ncbi:MAG: amidase [Bacteroidia bacterium]|nr:amidase [Bacteroidia bacterium]
MTHFFTVLPPKGKYFILLFTLFLSLNTLYGQISPSLSAAAQQLLGLEFDAAERDSMQDGLSDQRKDYEALRSVALPNSVVPSVTFQPLPPGFMIAEKQEPIRWLLPKKVTMPENRESLAFYSVAQLSVLIKTKKITSEELTRIYLNRLKKYGDTLECVVTLTEERAIERAKKADREIRSGKYRGPLHGIPYGVKDLLAVEGYPTTWGARPYQDQVLEETATVVERLDSAGAVLVAKLTMGALAWGDVWFGGVTRNPWNLQEGSSGSSAGSASATAAGLVAFSIGTETWGSIVSPSTRCGNSGLRPTYGRVSRSGAMALSWSMDKIGPICRTAEDCALVFEAIRGLDPDDLSLIDAPFNYDARTPVSELKVGYLADLFETNYPGKANDLKSLETLRSLGIDLIPIRLPEELPVNALAIILSAEAAAAFDELTRSNRDSLLTRQIKNAWPNVFRTARFIPAVEYIQANRIRTLLIQQMFQCMQAVDVVVTPSFEGNQLLMTNLTGHPVVVVPNGFYENGSPSSISFLGNLFGEAQILRLAKNFQEVTDFEDQHPEWLKP